MKRCVIPNDFWKAFELYVTIKFFFWLRMKVNFKMVVSVLVKFHFPTSCIAWGCSFLPAWANVNWCCQVSALSQTEQPSFSASSAVPRISLCVLSPWSSLQSTLLLLLIKGEFVSPWDQFTACISKRENGLKWRSGSLTEHGTALGAAWL